MTNNNPSRPPTYSQAVRNLQRYLRQLSYDDNRYPRVPVDGIFDTDTQEAVTVFQRIHGLDETGRVNYEAWTLIYEEYKASIKAASPPEKLSVFPAEPDGYSLKQGDSGFPVRAVQFLLNEISIMHSGMSLPDETINKGEYDSATSESVKVFQKISSLPVMGEVDKETWNQLLRYYNLKIPGEAGV